MGEHGRTGSAEKTFEFSVPYASLSILTSFAEKRGIMSFTPTSPVTGLAQSGLTTPTYTIVPDVAPDPSGKQFAVTALGGTQVGVTTHSVSSPFTHTMFRPKVLKGLSVVNPVTGQLRNVPRNTYKVITRKGVTPSVNQAATPLIVSTTIDVPAGSDLYDAANVRAALSAHFGLLSQVSSGIGDTCVSAIL